MKKHFKFSLALVIVSVLLQAGCTESPEKAPSSRLKPPGMEYTGTAFTFEKIREDLYHARGTGSLAVGSNSTIIINENSVMVVDSHISPAAIWALREELKTVTPKPILHVINTHFHFDHAHGNQIFPDDVEIIGHEYTREKLAAGHSKQGRAYDSFIDTLPEKIADLVQDLNTTTDSKEKSEKEQRLFYLRNFKTATDAVQPRAPTLTLRKNLTIHRGGREVQLHFIGRGHTGGDVVVYLPAEKIVITGDLLINGLPYMGDSYIADWVETLEHLKELDFDLILPGHGRPFSDREKIDHLQEYLLDLWGKVSQMHEEGVSQEEAAERIDMTNHSDHYARITGPGVNLHAVQRAYELLEGTAD